MEIDYSLWIEYNAKQTDREVRPLLVTALEIAGPPAGRTAVELGAGLGRESDALLRAGWRVHAVDWAPNTEQNLLATTRPEDRERLSVQVSGFGDLRELPPADLVYAGFSIPYVPRETFDALIEVVRGAIRPGGLFAANLLGVNDSYRTEHGDEFTYLEEDEVRGLFPGWDPVHFEVQDEDGQAFGGPKHWHLFHVVLRRPADQ